MNTNKLVTLVAVAALAAVSNADNAGIAYGGVFYSASDGPAPLMSGYLTPKRCYGHTYNIGRGWYQMTLRNENIGDLDAKVFTMSGRLLGMDLDGGNRPTVRFFSRRPQTIRVMAINYSRSHNADYAGEITRIR